MPPRCPESSRGPNSVNKAGCRQGMNVFREPRIRFSGKRYSLALSVTACGCHVPAPFGGCPGAPVPIPDPPSR
eukprot:5458846-Pyramimonas_sp.AAC.1